MSEVAHKEEHHDEPKKAADPHKTEPAQKKAEAAPAAPKAEAHPKTPAPASPAATGERPITSFFKKIGSGANTVVETTSAFGQSLRKFLRAGEQPPIHQVSIPKTPIYCLGHAGDGTGLNAASQAETIAEPIASGITAMISGTVGTVMGGGKDGGRIKRFFRNAARVVTSEGMIVKNIGMAVPRFLHRFSDRSIARNIEQMCTQLKRIPLIKELIATPATWISRKIADAVGAVVNGVDWATSPMDKMHNATAPKGSVTPATPAAAAKPAHAAAH